MKDFMEDCLFYLLVIPLVLGMCAVYWIARLCGYDLEDDF